MAARTSLVKTTASGSYPTAAVAVTFAAADASNKNSFIMNANELLIAWNGHATDPFTVTINSIADTHGRTKDITADSLAAGEMHVYGPFRELEGWQQASGVLHLEASSVEIKFAVIALPQDE
jgi:hypothetical protein